MSEITKTTELEKLSVKVEQWRDKKTCQGEKMPTELWKEIIALHKSYPHQAQLHRRLGVTGAQIKNKLREFGDERLYNDPAELCQIPAIPQDKKPIHEPNSKTQDKFSALATVVVELYRKDGVIMKIHTTTQSMQEIINSFLGGDNATINCQT